jgi:hypothetical protein
MCCTQYLHCSVTSTVTINVSNINTTPCMRENDCELWNNIHNLINHNNPSFNPMYYYCNTYSRCYAMTMRWADIPGPFLSNGSVNMFPFLGSRSLIMKQLDYSNRRAVFPMWSMPRCYWYKQGTISVDSWSWVLCRSLWREDLSPGAEE